MLVVHGDHLPKQNWIGGVSRKVAVHALGAKTGNADFVETGVTGQTNLIFVRYSAADNGLIKQQ
jgi:hypothetical protein